MPVRAARRRHPGGAGSLATACRGGAPVHRRRFPAASARAVRRRLHAALSSGAAAAGPAQRQGRTRQARIRPLGDGGVPCVGPAQGAARHRLRPLRPHGGAAHRAGLDPRVRGRGRGGVARPAGRPVAAGAGDRPLAGAGQGLWPRQGTQPAGSPPAVGRPAAALARGRRRRRADVGRAPRLTGWAGAPPDRAPARCAGRAVTAPTQRAAAGGLAGVHCAVFRAGKGVDFITLTVDLSHDLVRTLPLETKLGGFFLQSTNFIQKIHVQPKGDLMSTVCCFQPTTMNPSS